MCWKIFNIASLIWYTIRTTIINMPNITTIIEAQSLRNLLEVVRNFIIWSFERENKRRLTYSLFRIQFESLIRNRRKSSRIVLLNWINSWRILWRWPRVAFRRRKYDIKIIKTNGVIFNLIRSGWFSRQK